MTTDSTSRSVGTERSEVTQHPSPDGPGDQWAELAEAVRRVRHIAAFSGVSGAFGRQIVKADMLQLRQDLVIVTEAAARAAPPGEANSKGSFSQEAKIPTELEAENVDEREAGK